MKTFTIELTYEYSELDKEHQFGIFVDDPFGRENYVRWVYYYLGVNLGPNGITFYPYRLDSGKVINKYKFCNDAERQAKYIVKAIHRQLNKKS